MCLCVFFLRKIYIEGCDKRFRWRVMVHFLDRGMWTIIVEASYVPLLINEGGEIFWSVDEWWDHCWWLASPVGERGRTGGSFRKYIK